MFAGLARVWTRHDLVLPWLKSKKSFALSRSMAYHPVVQHSVGAMALALDTVGPHIDTVAEDWSVGVDHGALWPARIISSEYHAVEACRRIVDLATEVSGGTGMFKASELERRFRDAHRGHCHRANSLFVHEFVAELTLGIDLGDQSRWV
jgi:alkylation response protein AidB-like acyl-CoA dehydrogenase